MGKNTFQEIAESILGANPQPALFDSRECEDKVLKYPLVLAERKDGATSVPPLSYHPNLDIQPGEKVLILIMESPHIREYDRSFGRDPAPAQGPTGRNIRKYLPEILAKIPYEPQKVILMNSIQHQCSLGAKIEIYRDDVFAAAWENEVIGREKFKKRLKKYVGDSDDYYILNACTFGNQRKEKVNQAILDVDAALGNRLSTIGHPYSWFSLGRRGIERYAVPF